jgi:hypothetical protein
MAMKFLSRLLKTFTGSQRSCSTLLLNVLQFRCDSVMSLERTSCGRAYGRDSWLLEIWVEDV